MIRSTFLAFIAVAVLSICATAVQAEGLSTSKSHFYYKDASGRITGARIIRRYYTETHPQAAVDPRIDPRLRKAATIAQERSSAHTKARCWRYVKEALLESGAVSSYPKTNYACEAGEELSHNYGFQKLPIRDPYAAPVGAVIVYAKGSGGAGHVEIRTKNGFVSDYHATVRCYYPVLAIYAKFSS